MQSARINIPNTGFVGRTFMGKGKQYRSYEVPTSEIQPLELKDPINYQVAPNSGSAVFKEEQEKINRSRK